jgi:hypothetical protein
MAAEIENNLAVAIYRAERAKVDTPTWSNVISALRAAHAAARPSMHTDDV